MNKALVWLGVLVVVIIVVVVLAGRGDESGGAGNAAKAVGSPALDPVQERGNTTYDAIVARVGRVDSETDKVFVLRDYVRQTVTGSGTVVSAEKRQDGGWYVELDVSPEAADGTEVSVDVPAAKAKGQTLPTVGEEYRYKGMIEYAEGDENQLVLELRNGLVGK